MNKDFLKGWFNGSQTLDKMKYDLQKLCKIHNAVLVMVYDEKTRMITFKIGESLETQPNENKNVQNNR